jgi:hypothetical protein
VSFTKHSGGRIYANAQALVAPTSSKTIPRSQVKRAMDMAVMIRLVVKRMWRVGWKGSWGK